MCSPIIHTVSPSMRRTRSGLARPKSSRSVMVRSCCRPPEGSKVSPEIARSAMKNTVASATSVSVGMRCRCSMPMTPSRMRLASSAMRAGSTNGSGGSGSACTHCSARSRSAASGSRQPLRSRATSRTAMVRVRTKCSDECVASSLACTSPLMRALTSRSGVGTPSAASRPTSFAASAASASSTVTPAAKARSSAPWTWFRRLFSRISLARRLKSPALPSLPLRRWPSTGPGAMALIWISGPTKRARFSTSARCPAFETA